jgi:hypothetical protein
MQDNSIVFQLFSFIQGLLLQAHNTCQHIFTLGLIKQAPCHEGVSGNGGMAPPFLALALDGGEWSASHPIVFTSMETSRISYCIGGWVDIKTKSKLSGLSPRVNYTDRATTDCRRS